MTETNLDSLRARIARTRAQLDAMAAQRDLDVSARRKMEDDNLAAYLHNHAVQPHPTNDSPIVTAAAMKRLGIEQRPE